MGSVSLTEMIVLLAVIVLLFGSKRIPELAKGLGGSIRNFRGALHGDESDKANEARK